MAPQKALNACYAPAHLVAPDCDHGLVDSPGVGVEADTDLQGDVWVTKS